MSLPAKVDDARLLDAWERVADLARPWRELTLLESTLGIPIDDLAHLSIGARDRLLLELHVGMFGSRLDCETSCPSCGSRLELSVDAEALIVPPRAIESSDLELTEDDWTVRFRLPDSADIDACVDESGDAIAERCISVIARPEQVHVAGIPERVRARVAERMSELDAQADVSLDLTCAVCGDRWQAPFDPAAFVFREIDARAARVTTEVHRLASAYGWSEESVLAMSSARRRRYIELLEQ